MKIALVLGFVSGLVGLHYATATPKLKTLNPLETLPAKRDFAIKLRGGRSAEASWAPAKSVAAPEGDMNLPTFVFNLIADLCPHGMLPVAFGMAAAGGTGLAIAPSMLVFFALISTYTMVSIGRACQRTGRYSFSGVWGELLGSGSAWIVEVAIAILAFGCCVFYSAFIGDLFSSLAGAVDSLPEAVKPRWRVLGLLTAFPILPLCLMKNLSALQYTSFGGLVAILYTVVFVVLRALDGSYAAGGKFFNVIDAKYQDPLQGSGTTPWEAVGLFKIGPGLITLMNMACVAFMAHYNGVKYYEELEHRSIKRFTLGIGTSMAAALAVFTTMMFFGFKTFGSSAQTLLLNNYARSGDSLAGYARLATGCAILCGYPLMFSALKSSFFNACSEIFGKFKSTQGLSAGFKNNEQLKTSAAIAILAVITSIAANQGEEDIGLVVGLVGALLGSSANYIIPALLNLQLFKRDRGANSGKLSRGKTAEAYFNYLLLAFGAVFMVMGTVVTLQEAELISGRGLENVV